MSQTPEINQPLEEAIADEQLEGIAGGGFGLSGATVIATEDPQLPGSQSEKGYAIGGVK